MPCGYLANLVAETEIPCISGNSSLIGAETKQKGISKCEHEVATLQGTDSFVPQGKNVIFASYIRGALSLAPGATCSCRPSRSFGNRSPKSLKSYVPGFSSGWKCRVWITCALGEDANHAFLSPPFPPPKNKMRGSRYKFSRRRGLFSVMGCHMRLWRHHSRGVVLLGLEPCLCQQLTNYMLLLTVSCQNRFYTFDPLVL